MEINIKINEYDSDKKTDQFIMLKDEGIGKAKLLVFNKNRLKIQIQIDINELRLALDKLAL